MTDREKVQTMQDCNWKPANQYWKERAEKIEDELKLKDEKIHLLRTELEVLLMCADGISEYTRSRVVEVLEWVDS